MKNDTTSRLESLIPRKYLAAIGNGTIYCCIGDTPLLSKNAICFAEDFTICKRFTNDDSGITFDVQGPCKYGRIAFKRYSFDINEFMRMLNDAMLKGDEFILLEFSVEYRRRKVCGPCGSETMMCLNFLKNKMSKLEVAVYFDMDEVKKILKIQGNDNS